MKSLTLTPPKYIPGSRYVLLISPGDRSKIGPRVATKTHMFSYLPIQYSVLFFYYIYIFFLLIPFIIFAHLLLSLLPTRISQIRGHIAGSSPSFPLRYVPWPLVISVAPRVDEGRKR